MAAMETDDNQPQRMVCEACGSEQITRFAWAEWDLEAQEWQIGAIFEFAFCHNCRGSARVEAQPLAD